jgi:hypothetical protein
MHLIKIILVLSIFFNSNSTIQNAFLKKGAFLFYVLLILSQSGQIIFRRLGAGRQVNADFFAVSRKGILSVYRQIRSKALI